MAYQPNQIIAPGYMATTTATILPAVGTKTRIDALRLINQTGAGVTVTIWATPGGTAADSNRVVARQVLGNASDLCPELVGMILPSGSSLLAQASTVSALVIFASGTAIV